MKIVYASKVVDGKTVRYNKVIGLRKCKECGETFEPVRDISKFCSRKCSNKSSRDKSKEKNRERASLWYKNNKEHAKKKRKEYYYSHLKEFRVNNRRWRETHSEQKAATDKKYKDKTRHGDMREEAIEKSGLVCSKCGDKKSDRFDIVMHHVLFDKQKHEEQELLCRSCHGKIHMADRLKL